MRSRKHASPDIVDLAGALRRLGGNEDILSTLAQFFFDDSPGLTAEVAQGVAQRDAAAVQSAAHKLNGLSSNFGAQRAVAAALRLEALAMARDWSLLPAAATDLEQEISLLTKALAPLPGRDGV